MRKTIERIIATSLCGMLTFTIIPTAIPVIAQQTEESDEGIAPDASIPDKPQVETEELSYYENGRGQIYVRSLEGGNITICDLSHSEDIQSYEGISYDLQTNTLTINNDKEDSISITCQNMMKMKVNLIGDSEVSGLTCINTYPQFEGDGTFTIHSPLNVSGIIYGLGELGIAPISVSENAKVKVESQEEDEYCLRINITNYDESVDSNRVINANGTWVEGLEWQQSRDGGLRDVNVTLGGVRMLTKFRATELLKKKDSTEEKYYVKSLIGNFSEDKCQISQLIEKDGIWYEKYDGDDYRNSHSLFTNLSNSEIADLPDTLADGSGIVTAYLVPQTESNYYAYVKDNKVFGFNTMGLMRNYRVNPIFPEESTYGRDLAPSLMMKVINSFTDNGKKINLVRPYEEFDFDNTATKEDRDLFLEEKGYEQYLKKIWEPYNHILSLTNKTLIISEYGVKDGEEQTTGEAQTTATQQPTTEIQTTVVQQPTTESPTTAMQQPEKKSRQPMFW